MFLMVLWNSCKFVRKRSIIKSFYQGNRITIKNFNTYKKSTCAFFRGCLRKLLFRKIEKILRKTSLLEFLLSNLNHLIYHLTVLKIESMVNFLVNVPRNFKIVMVASVMESVYGKHAKFLHYTTQQKIALLKILGNFLFTRVASWQYRNTNQIS